MKIAIIDTLGLCYDGSTLEKRGLGGSESAVILMSKELAKIGFDVTVFNDCTSDDANPGRYDGVNYCPLKEVETGPGFDVMIGSRSVAAFAPHDMVGEFKNFIGGLPDFTNIQKKSKHKVLWMHDTFCDGDQHLEGFLLDGFINEIFTLSDFHTDYVTNCDHGRKRMFEVMKKYVFQTRNGIGNMPKKFIDIRQKDPNLFVYNSSVTKGMIPLVTKIWPRVKQNNPDAKLVVVGGYYKFRSNSKPDEQELTWRKLVSEYSQMKLDINFTGIITQKEISDLLTKASYMIYPPAFPETFGISALEALAHNVPLITADFGALEETAFDLACYKIPYPIEPNGLFPWIPSGDQENRFINMVQRAHDDKYLHQQKMYACNQVKDICGWDTVALQWKQHLLKKLGEYMPVDEHRKVSKINHKVHKVFGRRWANPEEFSVPQQPMYNSIYIVTPVYNAEKYITRCIESVIAQDYNNYSMFIIDDASTDNTRQVIDEYRNNLPPELKSKIFVTTNEVNRGAVWNQVNTIKEECGDGIVMLLDGDDWLVNDPTIFHKYNNLYNEGAEFTYGSCWSVADNIPLIAQEYPPEVKADKSYRNYKFNWNMPYTHLRTFRSYLMHGYLHDHGNWAFRDPMTMDWLKAGGDTAVFYAMIEYANPDKVVCVPDVVYHYNDLNPLNDYKVNGDEQTKNATTVLSKKTPKFSAIIPTMWRCQDLTKQLLTNLIEHPLVGEVLLIDNDKDRAPDWDILKHEKICRFKMGENCGVNPAWNLGVENSNYDLLCIINDDIVFDPKLFDKIEPLMYADDAGAFGIINGDPAMGQPVKTDGSIDFMEWQPGMIIHCFGQLMFTHKKNWVTIPDGLLINFGDDIIFHSPLVNGKKNYLIYNIEFETPMSATVSDPTVTLVSPAQFEKEREIFNVWFEQNPIPEKKPEPVTKTILIAIPCKNDIEADTFKSVYDLIIPEGYKATFQYFFGYAVDQVRNLIADWTVNGYDYLFAVDHDMIFAPDTLQKLLAADMPVVSGIYRQRSDHQTIEIYDHNMRHLPYENLYGKGLIEVGGCGFGCVLVKKEVFQDIGYPQFVYHQALNHANTFSEDLDFCTKARTKGYTIWCDTSIICGHVGQRVFTPELPMIPAESAERTRLRELRKMDLFPQDHINYLRKMKEDGFEPKVIYDIGACVLHWTDKAKTVWPNAEYVVFDAMDATKFIYEEEGLKHCCAVLGSEVGKEVEFWENTENPGGNSLYKENSELSPMADELFAKPVKRYTSTIDNIVATQGFPMPDLIKMDVQGAELDVIKGALWVINRCDNIILEMQHVDYNKGAPKAQEIIEYMDSIGFDNVSGMFCGGEVDGDYHFRRRQEFVYKV